MERISKIDLNTASEDAKKAAEEHVAQGYRITNQKLTLLHNVTAFQALEVQSYAVDRELARLVGKRAADFFEYAISLENDCLVCSTYFAKLLRQNGIEDFEHFDFTEEEKLLIEYGRTIAQNPKGVSDDLFQRLQAVFDEETLVVATTMGVFMIANNAFNDILQVQPESLDE
ncbi:MAG: carboxymuconolactone decarboxylase family protein [Anaerovoracaceae bacterium]